MNWTKRVPFGRASLRYSFFWAALWTTWLVLTLTEVFPSDGEFNRGWTAGFAGAMLLNVIFTGLGVLVHLRMDKRDKTCCKSQSE